MICEKCFHKYHHKCDSATCVRNAEAEAKRNRDRGFAGGTSSAEEANRVPFDDKPLVLSEGTSVDVKITKIPHAR